MTSLHTRPSLCLLAHHGPWGAHCVVSSPLHPRIALIIFDIEHTVSVSLSARLCAGLGDTEVSLVPAVEVTQAAFLERSAWPQEGPIWFGGSKRGFLERGLCTWP